MKKKFQYQDSASRLSTTTLASQCCTTITLLKKMCSISPNFGGDSKLSKTETLTITPMKKMTLTQCTTDITPKPII